ncbi:stage II sporulation protein M [Zongyangia sp. HA2173]|uniref:stage II sporulation protein M n=1 Tax=Zongyangia sp. HA2173 TaxID=3133035 RepID=UPI00316787C4
MDSSTSRSLRPGLFFRRELFKIFWISLVIFFLCWAVSYFVFYSNQDLTAGLFNTISQMFQENGVYTESGGISFFALLFNNIRASALMAILGIIPFLFLPAIILGYNAVIIGIACAFSMAMGTGVSFLVLALLPHGIFEIPALILSAALGIYLCKELVKKLVGRSRLASFSGVFLSMLRFYLCVILPLLVVAALVETYITPWLLTTLL